MTVTNIDGHALMALWGPTFGMVRALAPHLSPGEVEDIVGDAVLKVLRVDPLLDDRPDALQRYLSTAARNRLIDRQRHEARVWMTDVEKADMVRGTVDAGSARHVARLDLRAALEEIPHHYRRAVEARSEGYHVEEIAIGMGTTNQSVRAMDYRAYRQLRGLLEGAS